MFQTYVFYPLILRVISRSKTQNTQVYTPNDMDLPSVAIIFAAYNEEEVIREKLKSSLDTDYPKDKISIYVGSDASTDKTDEIVRSFQEENSNVHLKVFAGRTGKAGIINALIKEVEAEILVLTDANVMFTKNTLYQLIKHYKNPSIGLVGGNILNPDVKKDGISGQEKAYLSQENVIKYWEGITWGAMIGATGGVYSIRKKYYSPVPDKFIVDDFYITMKVLEKKGKAINELHAICFEDVSNQISEEFRRKSRISVGNFQNLGKFRKLINPFKGPGFAFLSHKVLRWCGPFFIIAALICSGFLAIELPLYRWLFWGQVGTIAIPVLDLALRKLKIHFIGFRFISHFYLMNLALMIGFFQYISGVKSNVWTPTKRFQ